MPDSIVNLHRSFCLLLCFFTFALNLSAQKKFIDEKGFVDINGIEQWISINGHAAKPVILILHGGPGSPLSPYADAIFKDWENDFILVQWDQRGAGKTFGRHAPEELTPTYLQATPLTMATMVKDGVDVAIYLSNHLKKPKIILFGTSWGSALGVQLAMARPDLFHAYIGHSQLVYPSGNFAFAYEQVYKMATVAEDKKSLEILTNIGKPPYDTARHAGQLMRIIKKYERLNSTPEPSDWFSIAHDYDNDKDKKQLADGDDYSFVNFVGDKRLGVQPMSQPTSGFNFGIPVYLMQGEEDILTPAEITKRYFDKIIAPSKRYFLLPKAAHGFNASVIEKLFEICKSVKL